MRRILFLTDSWTPQPTANAICIKNIASVLIQRGWNVYVNAFEEKRGQKKEVVDGIQIEYTRPTLSRQWITRAMLMSDQRKKNVVGNAGILLNRITRFLCLPFYPVVAPIFSKRWSKKVIQQIRENEIDFVVSVNAPLDSVAAGYFVKKKCAKVKWIAYYIDGGSNYGKEQNFLTIKRKLQKKSVRWENKVLSIADKIVIMEGHSEFYKKVLNPANRARLKILNVPLFHMQRMPKSDHQSNQSNKEIWTYAGTIREEFCNPAALFSWFFQYSENRDAELHLYGSTNMDDFLRSHCDNKHIYYHGLASHEHVKQVLADSDVLLYFRSEKLDSVSGKFFEYLMYHKPIVYFGPKDDINWRQLEKYPLGVAIDEKTWEQTNSFDEIFHNEEVVSDDMLKTIFYTSTPSAFADMIENIEKRGENAENN